MINVPNSLSVLRIFMIPVFVWCFFQNNLIGAAVALIISGVSDLFDGYFARKLNQITDLGKMLDPIADKLTLGAVVLCIWILYAANVPGLSICFSILLLKEVLMAVGSVVLLRRGEKPSAAKWYGKISTAFFYCTMILLVLFEVLNINFYGKNVLILVLICITAILAVGAFCGYTHIALGLLKNANKKAE